MLFDEIFLDLGLTDRIDNDLDSVESRLDQLDNRELDLGATTSLTGTRGQSSQGSDRQSAQDPTLVTLGEIHKTLQTANKIAKQGQKFNLVSTIKGGLIGGLLQNVEGSLTRGIQNQLSSQLGKLGDLEKVGELVASFRGTEAALTAVDKVLQSQFNVSLADATKTSISLSKALAEAAIGAKSVAKFEESIAKLQGTIEGVDFSQLLGFTDFDAAQAERDEIIRQAKERQKQNKERATLEAETHQQQVEYAQQAQQRAEQLRIAIAKQSSQEKKIQEEIEQARETELIAIELGQQALQEAQAAKIEDLKQQKKTAVESRRAYADQLETVQAEVNRLRDRAQRFEQGTPDDQSKVDVGRTSIILSQLTKSYEEAQDAVRVLPEAIGEVKAALDNLTPAFERAQEVQQKIARENLTTQNEVDLSQDRFNTALSRRDQAQTELTRGQELGIDTTPIEAELAQFEAELKDAETALAAVQAAQDTHTNNTMEAAMAAREVMYQYQSLQNELNQLQTELNASRQIQREAPGRIAQAEQEAAKAQEAFRTRQIDASDLKDLISQVGGQSRSDLDAIKFQATPVGLGDSVAKASPEGQVVLLNPETIAKIEQGADLTFKELESIFHEVQHLIDSEFGKAGAIERLRSNRIAERETSLPQDQQKVIRDFVQKEYGQGVQTSEFNAFTAGRELGLQAFNVQDAGRSREEFVAKDPGRFLDQVVSDYNELISGLNEYQVGKASHIEKNIEKARSFLTQAMDESVDALELPKLVQAYKTAITLTKQGLQNARKELLTQDIWDTKLPQGQANYEPSESGLATLGDADLGNAIDRMGSMDFSEANAKAMQALSRAYADLVKYGAQDRNAGLAREGSAGLARLGGEVATKTADEAVKKIGEVREFISDPSYTGKEKAVMAATALKDRAFEAVAPEGMTGLDLQQKVGSSVRDLVEAIDGMEAEVFERVAPGVDRDQVKAQILDAAMGQLQTQLIKTSKIAGGFGLTLLSAAASAENALFDTFGFLRPAKSITQAAVPAAGMGMAASHLPGAEMVLDAVNQLTVNLASGVLPDWVMNGVSGGLADMLGVSIPGVNGAVGAAGEGAALLAAGGAASGVAKNRISAATPESVQKALAPAEVKKAEARTAKQIGQLREELKALQPIKIPQKQKEAVTVDGQVVEVKATTASVSGKSGDASTFKPSPQKGEPAALKLGGPMGSSTPFRGGMGDFRGTEAEAVEKADQLLTRLKALQAEYKRLHKIATENPTAKTLGDAAIAAGDLRAESQKAADAVFNMRKSVTSRGEKGNRLANRKGQITKLNKDSLGFLSQIQSQASDESSIVGEFIDQGMAEGMNSGEAEAMATKVADAVLGAYREGFKIASPSKILIQYGQWVDEGLAKGMSQSEAEAAAMAKVKALKGIYRDLEKDIEGPNIEFDTTEANVKALQDSLEEAQRIADKYNKVDYNLEQQTGMRFSTLDEISNRQDRERSFQAGQARAGVELQEDNIQKRIKDMSVKEAIAYGQYLESLHDDMREGLADQRLGRERFTGTGNLPPRKPPETDGFGSALDEMANSAIGAAGDIFKLGAQALVAFDAFQRVTQLAQKGFRAALDKQNQIRQETVTPGARPGLRDELLQEALDKGLQLNKLFDRRTRTLASLEPFSETIDTEKAAKDLDTIISGLGAYGEVATRIQVGFSQGISKGVVSAEELFNQLGDAIPGVAKAAADLRGTDIQTLRKDVSTGTIDAATFYTELLDKLAQDFGARAESQSNSFLGRRNRIKTLENEVLAEFGEPLVMVTSELDKLKENSLKTALTMADAAIPVTLGMIAVALTKAGVAMFGFMQTTDTMATRVTAAAMRMGASSELAGKMGKIAAGGLKSTSAAMKALGKTMAIFAAQAALVAVGFQAIGELAEIFGKSELQKNIDKLDKRLTDLFRDRDTEAANRGKEKTDQEAFEEDLSSAKDTLRDDLLSLNIVGGLGDYFVREQRAFAAKAGREDADRIGTLKSERGTIKDVRALTRLSNADNTNRVFSDLLELTKTKEARDLTESEVKEFDQLSRSLGDILRQFEAVDPSVLEDNPALKSTLEQFEKLRDKTKEQTKALGLNIAQLTKLDKAIRDIELKQTNRQTELAGRNLTADERTAANERLEIETLDSTIVRQIAKVDEFLTYMNSEEFKARAETDIEGAKQVRSDAEQAQRDLASTRLQRANAGLARQQREDRLAADEMLSEQNQRLSMATTGFDLKAAQQTLGLFRDADQFARRRIELEAQYGKQAIEHTRVLSAYEDAKLRHKAGLITDLELEKTKNDAILSSEQQKVDALRKQAELMAIAREARVFELQQLKNSLSTYAELNTQQEENRQGLIQPITALKTAQIDRQMQAATREAEKFADAIAKSSDYMTRQRSLARDVRGLLTDLGETTGLTPDRSLSRDDRGLKQRTKKAARDARKALQDVFNVQLKPSLSRGDFSRLSKNLKSRLKDLTKGADIKAIDALVAKVQGLGEEIAGLGKQQRLDKFLGTGEKDIADALLRSYEQQNTLLSKQEATKKRLLQLELMRLKAETQIKNARIDAQVADLQVDAQIAQTQGDENAVELINTRIKALETQKNLNMELLDVQGQIAKEQTGGELDQLKAQRSDLIRETATSASVDPNVTVKQFDNLLKQLPKLGTPKTQIPTQRMESNRIGINEQKNTINVYQQPSVQDDSRELLNVFRDLGRKAADAVK